MTGAGPPDDFYRILGVLPDASAADITRAYRRRARAVHPDARPDEGSARFQALAAAYWVLGDPARRAAYDRSRHRDARGPARQAAHDHAFRRSTSGLDPFARPAADSFPRPPAPAAAPARPGSKAPPSRPAGYPVGPALWAGPTLVEPPAADAGPISPDAGPIGPGAAGRARLALLALLLARHLDRAGEDWPW